MLDFNRKKEGGGQTRAFIHIQDTVRCLELAINNPPKVGDRVQIFNQITETYSVKSLAKIVSELTGAKIDYLPNPRYEAAENEFVVSNKCFLSMGLNPITLEKGLLEEVQDIATAYKDRCDISKIPATAQWRAKI